LVGGLAFIGGYSPVLGAAVSSIGWIAGISLAVASLWALYVHPVPLGPPARPRRLAMATYAGCVFGELALIAVGSRTLVAAGQQNLQPALIAILVGLHFIPFC
jgi:hypothetical protein